MEIALILPVHNHLEFTQITLKELAEQSGQIRNHNLHVVLVDDGSSDGTSEWVRDHYPAIIILEGDGNLWWSGAVNLGVKYALDALHVDYIILWNNDIQVGNTYFQSLVAILLENDSKTIIGSKIFIKENPGLIWSMGGFFNPITGSYGMYGYYEKDSQEYNAVRFVDWLPGMGTIVPRDVIEKIGYWDNINFPQYHGDSDFTYRAKLSGFPIKVYPTLRILNSVKNSGINHEGNFKQLLRLITDIRSKSNLNKSLKFYHRYAKSYRAYLPIIWLYIRIFGGFLKLKTIEMLHVKRLKAILK